MLNISESLKNILRNDRFPMTNTVTPKDLEITFAGMDPIYADQIVDDSFSLTESIISDNDIRFGTCRASQIKFKLANVPEDLKSKEFTIDQLIGATDVIPLGKYKVDSAKLQDDLIFKDVIAYDKFRDIDIDVSAWYNALTFPMTLKAFRSSLLAYLGIEEVDQTLPNDDMEVTKTIEPTQISGRTVLEATVELNGAFGHINREGKFTRIVLQPSYGLYPSETLYPSEALYPVSETDTSYTQEDIVADTVSKAMYESVRFEEYSVKEIDKLQIRAEENDIGAIVGAGTNAYVIEGNFLVFGKSAEELERIAINAFGNMAKRPYRLYEAQSIGLSYVEVGDALQFATDDTVVGYVLQRTLTGIQALKDEFEAPGSEEREQNFGVNKEIIQLQGKTTRIKKDVDGISVEIEDLAQETASRFEQTATQISTEVTRSTQAEGALDSKITQTAESITQEVTRATEAEGTLSGSIETLAGQVVLKVDADGNIAVVDLNADPSEGSKVTIKADNISLEGLITANGNFKIDEYGNIEATNGKFEGEIKSTNPTTGSVLKMWGADLLLTNSNNVFIAGINNKGQINGKIITATEAFFTTLNEGTPITSKNISDQSVAFATDAGNATTANYASNAGNVAYATEAGYASSAGSVWQATLAKGLSGGSFVAGEVYVSANYNFRPFGDGNMSCGTSEGRWSSVWALNGSIITSDEREKIDISPLEEDERFIQFAKMIAPYSFKMINGTSGRKHTGFIAQRIEEAMTDCEISDMEFAGLIKAPVYAEKLKDEDGNELEDFDTNSDIIDYSYSLRYDEFIPLLFLWMRSQEVNE